MQLNTKHIGSISCLSVEHENGGLRHSYKLNTKNVVSTSYMQVESCRDWTSSSIGPVLYIPYHYILWHPLSIMSFVSGISDDIISFDETVVLF